MIPVILWGAFVRLSKSGAGCGEHWPSCRGEVLPVEASMETLIEFTHRAMSGLLGLAVLVLVIGSWRTFPRGHRVRKAAMATLIFVITEGAIGAMLVLLGLVGGDERPVRGLVIALHLVNTLGLLACSVLTAHFAGDERPTTWKTAGRARTLLMLALGLVTLTAATGAVTALGDTLFPRELHLGEGLWPHIQAELSAGQHVIVRLRALHPFLATFVALFLLFLVQTLHQPLASMSVKRWSSRVAICVVAQVALGVTTIALAAPAWLQLTHLLVADLLWAALVLLTVNHLQEDRTGPLSAAEAKAP